MRYALRLAAGVAGLALHAGQAIAAPPRTESAAALYVRLCAACHGKTMQGAEGSPPLDGARFRAKWPAGSLDKLAEKIGVTMPQDDPGTLQPVEARMLAKMVLARSRSER